MKNLFVALILGLSFVQGTCPGSVWCDYHSSFAFYAGDEWPSGKHYRVYSHQYAEGARLASHSLRVRCD